MQNDIPKTNVRKFFLKFSYMSLYILGLPFKFFVWVCWLSVNEAILS